MTDTSLPAWPIEPANTHQADEIWASVAAGLSSAADAARSPRSTTGPRSSRHGISLMAAAAGVVIAAGLGAGVWAITRQASSTPPAQGELVAQLDGALAASRDANSLHARVTASPDGLGQAYCVEIEADLAGPVWTKTATLSDGIAGLVGCPENGTATTTYYATSTVVRASLANTATAAEPGLVTSNLNPGVGRAQLEADLYLDALDRLLAAPTGDVTREGATYIVPTQGATIEHCPANRSDDPAAPCQQPRPVDHLEITLDEAGRLAEVRFEAGSESSAGLSRRPDQANGAGFVAVQFAGYDEAEPARAPEAPSDRCTQVEVDVFECAPDPEPEPPATSGPPLDPEPITLDDAKQQVYAAIDATLASASYEEIIENLQLSPPGFETEYPKSCERYVVDRSTLRAVGYSSFASAADEVCGVASIYPETYFGPTFHIAMQPNDGPGMATDWTGDLGPEYSGLVRTVLGADDQERYFAHRTRLTEVRRILDYAHAIVPDSDSQVLVFEIDAARLEADRCAVTQAPGYVGRSLGCELIAWPDRLTVATDDQERLTYAGFTLSDSEAALSLVAADWPGYGLPSITETRLTFHGYDESVDLPPEPPAPTEWHPGSYIELCDVPWAMDSCLWS